MRYRINFNKTINQLVPYYIGGRKLILYLQSLIEPLQSVNASFIDYAKETRIEATMTSQIFRFEWYLNRKFSKYFKDPSQRITITNGGHTGTVLHNEGVEGMPEDEKFRLYQEAEEGHENSSVLYHNNEYLAEMHYSFIVNTPAIDHSMLLTQSVSGDITEAEKEFAESNYKAMLKSVIEKYRLAGKTYTIRFNR